MRIAAATILIALTALARQPDPVIEKARADAARYAQSIPNYLVNRTTTRYRAKPSGKFALGGIFDWRHVDSVSAEVASHDGREVYSGIRINGRPSKGLPRDGVWSRGEFSTLLEEILAPKHAAVFSGRTQDTTLSRPAWHYRFEIDQKHSGWDMVADLPNSYERMRIAPRYSGAIWIDRVTGKVLRIEKSARKVPRRFPLQLIESATDYSLVTVGGESYMLPTRTETITCTRRDVICYKNETVFENYRKFDASATITFE
jgi:hypothetical protein